MDAALEYEEQGVAQMFHAFGVTVRFAPQPSQVTAQPVIHALDGVGLRFAFEVLRGMEELVVAPVLAQPGQVQREGHPTHARRLHRHQKNDVNEGHCELYRSVRCMYVLRKHSLVLRSEGAVKRKTGLAGQFK